MDIDPLAEIDESTTDEIDRAIIYARKTPGLRPQVKAVFIDALLDKRLELMAQR